MTPHRRCPSLTLRLHLLVPNEPPIMGSMGTEHHAGLPPGRPPWDKWNGIRVGGVTGAVIGAIAGVPTGGGWAWVLITLAGTAVGGGTGYWLAGRSQRPPTGH